MARWLRALRVWIQPADPPPDGTADTRPFWQRVGFFIGFRGRW